MYRRLAFAALLLPFMSPSAMAQTAGTLFPPENASACVTASNGNTVAGVLTWTGSSLTCRPFSMPACGVGQVVGGIANGVVNCVDVTPLVNPGNCGPGKVVTGIASGQLFCADNTVPATCPTGQFVTQIASTGAVTCSALPDLSCPVGQVVIGIRSGQAYCGTTGTGTQGDDRTSGAPPVQTGTTVTSCIGEYCSGNNNIIFPGRNAAGAKTAMPARCRGSWWADLRDSRWESFCTTGMEVLTSCVNDTGQAIPNCPDTTAAPARTQLGYCTDFVCKGTNTTVTFVNSTLSKRTVASCVGEWTANVRDNSWTSTCSTGWVGPAPGTSEGDTPTPTASPTAKAVVACSNASCSGTDDVIFPVRNAAGAYNPYPYYCNSNWTTDVRGSNFVGNCTGNQIELRNCVDPRTNTAIPNCPDNVTAPTTTQSFVCNDTMCKGVNSRVQGTNGDGKTETATCTGEWVADLRGSNWTSTCSTQWKDLASQAGTSTQTPTPTTSPDATNTGTGVRVVSCIENSCSGTNSIVFPLRNAVGGINKYPYYCQGNWTADVRGPRWIGACTTTPVELRDCLDPVTRQPIANCPDNTPAPATTINANCYSVCKGRNTRVTGVNADGKGAIATCLGEWSADVRGANWISSCSTGWENSVY